MNFIGTPGDDSLVGSSEDDILFAGKGDDNLTANEGDDSLFAGDGADDLFGGAGHDTLRGENGNDLLKGGEGNDLLEGNNGVDVLYGDGGDDSLRGGNDDDFLQGGNGNDSIDSGNGNDLINGGDGDDLVFESNGNDSIIGSLGNDTIFGGDGTDRVDYRNLGQPIILLPAGQISKGEAGFDQATEIEEIIAPENTVNSIDNTIPGGGFAAIDVDLSENRITVLNPLLGDRTITIKNFTNVTATFNADTVVGDEQNNLIDVAGGDDIVDGGAGDDTIAGGAGVNTLTGGEGADTFTLSIDGTTEITDFESGVDKIELVGEPSDFRFENQSAIFAGDQQIASFGCNTFAESDVVFVEAPEAEAFAPADFGFV